MSRTLSGVSCQECQETFTVTETVNEETDPQDFDCGDRCK